VAAFAAVLTLASAQEVQPQELVFEKWVRDTFFGGYRPAGYAQRWDIPATENKDHGDIPGEPEGCPAWHRRGPRRRAAPV
jgi:hypothetical protein